MKMHARLASIALLLSSLLTAGAQAQQPQTVTHVELDRYAGKWYEIARFPNKFQSQCASDVTADYIRRDDGQLDVINRCKKGDGAPDEAKGRARVADTVTNAKLDVRFAPDWLAWLPTVWAPYWIVDLASDYAYAAVGDPKREFLWILSRTPQLPDHIYEDVVNQATAQGYDTARLVKTRQQSQ
jgi:apolipoprotein D and lipocalin family protein